MAVKKDTVTGKWYYYGMIKTINGLQKQYKKRGFKTKAEAIRAEQIFRSSFDSDPSGKQLDELHEEFILYSESRKKRSTVDKDKQIYRLHIQPYFGKSDYLRITVKEILLWQQELLETKKLTSGNINNAMKTFNKYYSYSKKIYQTNYNPITLAGRLKEPKREYVTWDIDEFSAFFSTIDDIKLQAGFHLLYFSGIRRGEFLALQWTDFDGQNINISKTCSYIKGGYQITEPKTENSNRIIALDRKSIELLNSYKAIISKEDSFEEDWYIFGDKNPMPFNELTRQKNKYEKIADVRHIRIHDFRHSHISMLVKNNIPLPAIAERAGDTLDTIINTYVHNFKSSNDLILENLNSIRL